MHECTAIGGGRCCSWNERDSRCSARATTERAPATTSPFYCPCNCVPAPEVPPSGTTGSRGVCAVLPRLLSFLLSLSLPLSLSLSLSTRCLPTAHTKPSRLLALSIRRILHPVLVIYAVSFVVNEGHDTGSLGWSKGIGNAVHSPDRILWTVNEMYRLHGSYCIVSKYRVEFGEDLAGLRYL